jgi:beta-lactam-binding protein with PASTA domain
MNQEEKDFNASENPQNPLENNVENNIKTNESAKEGSSKAISLLKRLHNSPLGVIFHLLLMAALGLLFLWAFLDLYLPYITQHNQTITVPDLKGMTLQEAEETLKDMGLRFEVYDSSSNNFDKNKKPLEVLLQDPLADDKVKNNRIIYLTINPTMPPMVRIPESLLENSVKNAQVRFRALGLNMKIRYIDGDYPNTVEKIFYQQKELKREILAKGFEIPKGSEVLLWVSNGITGEDNFIDSPNLYGMPLDEAEWVLTGVGLVIGKISEADSEQPAGVVIMQSSSSPEDEKDGKRRIGSIINITISNGKKPIVVDTTSNQD